MNKQTTLIQATVAALLLAAGLAHAAPRADVTQLPRVVVSGKSMQPTQLPRVVITGLSLNSQLQQQVLAAAKTETKPARRI